MKKLLAQIIKFGAVGFLCFFIDYAIMVGLTELVGIPSLIKLLLQYYYIVKMLLTSRICGAIILL